MSRGKNPNQTNNQKETMLERDVREVRECVFGNGKPGLKYEIVRIKSNLKFNTWLTGAIALALITGVIKLLFFF